MNRKSKAILYAVLGVFGIVGASASLGANQQPTIYHRQSANNYEQLDPADQGESWNCNPGSSTCTYQKINQTGATVDANMTRAQTGVFVQ